MIGDALRRAVEGAFTRPIPKSAGAQMRYLVKQMGSTKAVAGKLGVTQRTVERYAKGEIKKPRAALAQKMEGEVRRRWQPRNQAKARARAAQSGITIETRARFGFTAAPGTTDDGRMRRITQPLSPEYADRLIAAQEAGAPDAQLQQIAAEGIGHGYFRDGGARAGGLAVDFTDIDYIDFSL